jgi:hypothetical protein
MNKHTKIAVLIAPFLAIGGYVASGYYLDSIADKEQLLKLKLEAPCNLIQSPCKLTADHLLLELSLKDNRLSLATSHPLNQATVSILNTADNESVHRLTTADKGHKWQSKESVLTASSTTKNATVRIHAVIQNLNYLHEFKLGL